MATNTFQVVNNEVSKSKHSQPKNNSLPIRIKKKTKSKIDELVLRANKNHVGRKVKADDLILFSLNLLNDAHLEEICSNVLTNKDRFEILFRKVTKENHTIDREKFIGLLLEGKINKNSF